MHTPHWDAADKFRPTADLLPVLIWIADTDKLCTWFNTTWLEFVGRTMEQEIGNGWAENVHPDDFDRCLRIYVSSFDARKPFRMEYRLRRFDGRYLWILDEGRPMYDAGGEFTGYIGCCLLIDDQKVIEEQLSVANNGLLDSNARLARLLERERRVAHALQDAFLPPFLPNVQGLAFDACYRPAESESRVGGDWYDVIVLPDGRIAFSIGDVFGHGIEAAGAMIRLRETLRAVTGVVPEDPATILRAVDQIFQASHPGIIASAVHAIYDPAARRLLVANAGHPQPVLVRSGVPSLLPHGDVLLGVTQSSDFMLHERILEPGDWFVLYTDGLVEIGRNILEGTDLLLKCVASGTTDAAALVSELTYNRQQDDVAVLAVSVPAREGAFTGEPYESDELIRL